MPFYVLQRLDDPDATNPFTSAPTAEAALFDLGRQIDRKLSLEGDHPADMRLIELADASIVFVPGDENDPRQILHWVWAAPASS